MTYEDEAIENIKKEISKTRMPDGTPMNVHYVHATRADVYRYWLDEANSLTKKLVNDFIIYNSRLPMYDRNFNPSNPVDDPYWKKCTEDLNKLMVATK